MSETDVTTVEVVEKAENGKEVETVKETEKDTKAENGKDTENGKEAENGKKAENGLEAENGSEPETVVDGEEPLVCPVKRKSGSDATAKAEGATPEKKAKLDESPAAEAEAKGEAEVAA